MQAKTKEKADQLDKLIGANLRRIRLLKELSQERLGEFAGVTFQQIQKYEKGINRISGSKLHRLAIILKCGILDFYEGADELIESGSYTVKMPDPQEMEILLSYRKMGTLNKRHVFNLITGIVQDTKAS